MWSFTEPHKKAHRIRSRRYELLTRSTNLIIVCVYGGANDGIGLLASLDFLESVGSDNPGRLYTPTIFLQTQRFGIVNGNNNPVNYLSTR